MLDRVFSNRYRLTEKLGVGGMAEVYKATDEVLGRTVAVKVMLPQYAGDSTFAARFKQEAQSAANLQSPYIVNIYDWGYESSDGIYFIVMEYVRGTDLKTAIQQRGAINQRKAAEIGSQVCAALSVAHGYDIIHRDIKPHNIMVQPDGNAKVMDFGIARASGSSMTQTGSVLGTAYYVSPEQAQGKTLTPATDLYSLGIVLYEATTGKVPFDAPDAVSVALKQVNELPLYPSSINPDIDPELEAIILRAMEKDPQERYATAEQMRTALNNYLAGRPINTDVEPPAEATRVMSAATTLPVISSDGARSVAHTAVMPSVAGKQQALSIHSSSRAREAEQNRRRRTTIIVGVLIVLFLFIIAGVIIFALNSNADIAVTVPNVVNMTEQEARSKLKEYELQAEVSLASHPTVEQGRVISSDPPAREKVEKNSVVNLVVSSGPEAPKKAKVPDLKNKTPGAAEDALTAVGLKFARGAERFDPDVEEGKVCGQDIDPDTEVNAGTTVTYYVSKGKDTARVPSVVGAKADVAEGMLKAEDFKVEYAEPQYSNDYAEGIVMHQSPAPGSADRGITVILTVSKGPEPVAIPDLTGKTELEVRLALVGTKLEPLFIYEVTTAPDKVDKVMRQEPAPGTAVPPNSQIKFYMGKAPGTP